MARVSRSNMAQLPLKVPAVPTGKGGCTTVTTARHATLVLIGLKVKPVVFAAGRSNANTM